MARKHAKNAGLLIPDVHKPAASRYLPASVQALLLPAEVRQAATGKHINQDQRAKAHEVFVRWAEKLALGQLHGLTETQVESDFTGGLLAALGYVSQAGSTTDFTMLPKWPVPGVGAADAALGLFQFEPDGTTTSQPLVLCELKGAGTDRDRKRDNIGNPPYVRQERLGDIKPHLQANYVGYHGMADLYVYFYERGLSLLRPGGRLAYVVTNKWMKAGYGEPLRRLFSESAWVESVIDFGHAKQFFKDADVFPCFLVVRKPDESATPPELEPRLHDLVNEAYGLTPEEVRLMWDTAPPRMPIPRPPGV